MDDCKQAIDLDNFSSLDVVDFYSIPHYTNFPFEKVVENIITKYDSKLKLCPISNSQTILVTGEKVKIVTK